jgi:diguanylate cyclase (GGDEF)-like protein/PAS domain S-box-containing protein
MLAAVAYWIVPYSSIGELLIYDGVVLLSTIAAVIGWRRAPAAQRFGWGCVSAALVLFLLGELIWWGLSAAGQEPFPSVADASFLLGYVPLAIAAAALAAAWNREPDRSAWLDAGVLTAVAGIVIFNVLMEPYVHDPSSTAFAKLATIAYPLADILILGFVLRLGFSRQSRHRSALMLTAGVGLMFVADMAFAWQSLRETFVSGSWVDAVWLASYVMIGFAALNTSSDRILEAPEVEHSDRGRLALVLVVVTVPQAMLIGELISRGLIGLNTFLVAVCVSTLVMALVSIRLWRLLGRARRIEEQRGAERLSALIHHSADAIFLLSPEGQITFASPAAAALRNTSETELLGTSLFDAFAPESRQAITTQLGNLVVMPVGATLPIEGRVDGGTGPDVAVEGTGCNLLADENVGSIVVTLRDVTTRRQLEAQLERRAFHDELTGLANRALFADRVAHALERSARREAPSVAIVFIDLDDFKAVNDGMGHGAGDELLCGVAARIRDGLRPVDTVARLGGDEFAVLLEDVGSYEEAAAVGDRVLELLQLPIEVSGVSLAVPASVGVTLASLDSDAESLLRNADIAMYNAKSKGKGQVAMFDEALLDIASQRLALKIELPEALRAGQFSLDYQPIIDVHDGSVQGFEALIRWHHPERGLVPPADFIPAAEATGAIVDIGRWVLEEACRQAVVWNADVVRPLSMSVNVSPLQLQHPGFVDDLHHVLERSGLPPSLLILELTEAVLARQDRVRGVLDGIRRLGVGIAIDDFGTGYSSLSYLKDFPVTRIKVDRSFMSGLESGGDRGLLESILSMAEALRLTCVMEGVETKAQLDELSRLNCEMAQGFHLGRPMSAAAVDGLVASNGGSSDEPGSARNEDSRARSTTV